MEETRARGLLVGKGGKYGNVVRMAPPLTLTEAEADEGSGHPGRLAARAALNRRRNSSDRRRTDPAPGSESLMSSTGLGGSC